MKKSYIVVQVLLFLFLILSRFDDVRGQEIWKAQQLTNFDERIFFSEFTELDNDNLYIPVLTSEGLRIEMLSLKTMSLGSSIIYPTQTIINPIVRSIGEEVWFVDYSTGKIVIFDKQGSLIRELGLENEHRIGEYPAKLATFVVVEDHLFIKNPFLRKKGINILQKYDLSGKLVEEFPGLVFDHILTDGKFIYLINYEIIRKYTVDLELIDIIRLKGEEFDQYAQYLLYGDELIALGSENIYKVSKSGEYESWPLERTFLHKLSMKNLRLLGNDHLIWLVDFEQSLVYQINF